MSTIWAPLADLSSETSFALLLLNNKVEKPGILFKMWNDATLRVTVDGGTTVWQNLLDNFGSEVAFPVPDLITGDFDSADLDHVEHFRALGARVVATPDQDHTDFTKALIELDKVDKMNKKDKEGKVDKVDKINKVDKAGGLGAVAAFIESGGRVDHMMGNFQTLALVRSLAPSLPPVYLCSSHSMSWLLMPGKHTIVVPDPAPAYCGLIPLDGKAIMSTSGLKWNLTKQTLRFGELVSTSNSFSSETKEVIVETDSMLLWTMDLPQGLLGKKN